MRIVFASAAREDVREILRYYRAPSAAADRFAEQVDAAIEHLEHWPQTAVRRRDLTRRNVIFWSLNPHLMVLQRNGAEDCDCRASRVAQDQPLAE